jgi:hypothetical protein
VTFRWCCVRVKASGIASLCLTISLWPGATHSHSVAGMSPNNIITLLERQPIGGSPKPQGAVEVSERSDGMLRTTIPDWNAQKKRFNRALITSLGRD